jgi:hypothetical protein
MMKAARRFAVFAIAALLLGLPLRAQTPSVLEPKEPGKPLWISADALANERFVDLLERVGSVALRNYVRRQQCAIWQRLAAEQIRKREEPRIAALPPSACQSVLLVAAEEDKPSSSLGDLLTHSRSIVRGMVRTTGFGFSFGIPFSLLSVEVSEVVQGPRSEVSDLRRLSRCSIQDRARLLLQWGNGLRAAPGRRDSAVRLQGTRRPG